jgi:branched-chain amino acid transport system ATP-binding protein
MNSIQSENLLSLKNIKVHYGGVKALDSVDINLDEGEIVALMGPNGAGKSTVLKALFGLAPIETGQICWHGQKIIPKSHEMVERGISFVPQGRQVFKSLTVYENLEMGGYFIDSRDILKSRIEGVLDIFPDLKKKLKENAGDLSGGQQQMLAIARGLISDPKVLLLDEPSLGLAPKVVKEVFAKIKEINERRQTAIMIVEHNLHSVLSIVDRAYLLDKGKIVVEDVPDEIINSGILEKVFLGKS